ncbi:uncharacterized protein LAESUDRAFT_710131 [Laetiporus sulphureus 93-53]|uniref:Uncharacterized protein n=1 Tax=Laetiporus sulphureus 93-53 TaxID=1314785 RepID=A0A165IG88_9APHY|nr:uncharacterized protein LAESUDRAFT_710131 [Laetiporus sulphureus 93-53]KZT13031.1 hypothetical protein LAESUDRAFT_710131 [Laetiporus sulphureus 93-53]
MVATEDNIELCTLRDELAAVAATITSVQRRFVAAIARSEQRMKELEGQVNRLQAEKAAASRKIRNLHVENAQLREELESKKEGVAKAVPTRVATPRKLYRAKKAVQDPDEHKVRRELRCVTAGLTGTSKSAFSSSAPTQTAKKSQDAEDTDSSDDDEFAEASASFPDDIQPESQSAMKPRKSAPNTSETVPHVTSRRVSEDPKSKQAQVIVEARTSRRGAPAHSEQSKSKAKPQKTKELQINFSYLEYSRPPATAAITAGPYTYRMLQERLGLDDDTMIGIENLEWMRDPCMRIHIHDDMMFVLQPLVYEGPSSYLISWSEEIVNQNMKEYIVQGDRRPVDSVFHMFANPCATDAWFYLGAHKLTVRELRSVWHKTLRGQVGSPSSSCADLVKCDPTQDKHKLAAELEKRWRYSPLDRRDIAGRVEQGELEQFCIELDSTGQLAKSIDFVKTLGGEYRLKDGDGKAAA